MQLRNLSFANRSSSFPLETCQGRNDGDDTGEECRRGLRSEMRGRAQSLWARIWQRPVQGDTFYI